MPQRRSVARQSATTPPGAIQFGTFDAAGKPSGGWLRHIRQKQGLTLQAVADRLDVSPQAVHQFEKSEVAGTISLRQLQGIAAAMGCNVEYRVSEQQAKEDLATGHDPAPVGTGWKKLPATGTPELEPPPAEHSILLMNQADGRFD